MRRNYFRRDEPDTAPEPIEPEVDEASVDEEDSTLTELSVRQLAMLRIIMLNNNVSAETLVHYRDAEQQLPILEDEGYIIGSMDMDIDQHSTARICPPKRPRTYKITELGKHKYFELSGESSKPKEEPKIDKTKQPRIWMGAELQTPLWWWQPIDRYWSELGARRLDAGTIFIGGNGPRPTIDPTDMALEECSEVDWEDYAMPDERTVEVQSIKPRVWRGPAKVFDHWCWDSCRKWRQYRAILFDGEIFVGGHGPEPEPVHDASALPECHERDW